MPAMRAASLRIPPGPSFLDIPARLRRWAETRGHDVALTLHEGTLQQAATFTYAEIDRRARAIAAALQDRARPGSRALLVYPPGMDFITGFLGCLYAGVLPVPTYAPHPAQLRKSLERFLPIVRDARPEVFLTTGPFALALRALAAATPRLWRSRILNTATLDVEALAPRWAEPRLDPDSVAFIQYTSGSTSSPKGVIVTHGNLVHNLSAIRELAADIPEPRGVSWLPPYHDMGLIGGILQPLYAGFPAHLLSPLAFLGRPLLWLETISHVRATVSPLPNFALELCVRKVSDEQARALDLSSWRVAINGAEPIRKASLDRFTARFGPAGFRPEVHRPVYGLAEATLMVSCDTTRVPPRTMAIRREAAENGRVELAADGDADAATFVSCGRSIAGQTITIVDPETLRRCPEGVIGEIWIRGPSVAKGYWNKPEETREVFGAYLGDGGEGPFLRTGDLGFLDREELFVTGRRKDLIIIAGRNHYPQDIEEAAARSHPAIRPGCCVAFGLDDRARGERIVVVAECDARRAAPPSGHLDVDDVIARVRTEIRARVGVDADQVVLVKPRTLSKTSSGKIRRFATRAAFLEGMLETL
jgi:acyl-CoA synthetase (AMP-forming)/AMP-acid ligase II